MRRKNPHAKSNLNKIGSTMLHNILAGKSKGEMKESERVRRIQYLLEKHDLSKKNARKILDQAKLEGIRIDKIEAEIIEPMQRKILAERAEALRPDSEMSYGKRLKIIDE
jgi:hypothetical protein